ncbi:inositol monophosphatase [Patescibacteria group bacterium]|nr:inositol monophosphatase [Patescibacteria group bacterium]MBU1123553.1 inositol monophosphatase [Patescibacteria group bacterium]MBU1911604.1 inositol monophosphatase [Patescibacteria group bacterium]
MSKEVNLDIAMEVALPTIKKAAELALEYHKKIDPKNAGSNLGIDTKRPRDYVTDADKAVQKMIIEEIQKTYPSHRFIAEEEGSDNLGDPESPYTWIIDPIDGTCPFIHGRPHFGTIIALKKDDEVVLGLMYMPLLDELYTCIKGNGAFFNDKPVVLRNTRNMDDAVLCSNFRRTVDINGIAHLPVILCANTENYGCAVYELGLILQGLNDGFYCSGPRLWDIAAGCLMIEEAGGKARYELKEPDNVRSGVLCATSTAAIFEELEEFVFNKMKYLS